MGKKKGSNKTAAAASVRKTDKSTTSASSRPSSSNHDAASPAPRLLGPNDALYAVIEFHHMLIGPTHKKEAAAISAAAAHGICGFVFMGGPSVAVIEAACVDDVSGWLSDCKKAGKPGTCVYWKAKNDDDGAMALNNKLKTMPYAAGKDTKMDSAAYQAILAQLNVALPLPPCTPLY